MSGKILVQIENPKTQSLDAVKALLAWKQVSCDPLPEFVEMGKEESRLVLVLSNKRDAYYTTTAAKCSCPAAHYHRGPCKHQRKYFPQPEATKVLSANDSIRPEGKWAGGMNGPIDPDQIKAVV